MLLLPIARDDAEIRRHAWISYAIIAVNIIIFVTLSFAEKGEIAAIDAEYARIMEYLAERPYLALPPALDTLVPEEEKAAWTGERDVAARRPYLARQEQEAINEQAELLRQRVYRVPSIRYAYSESDGTFLTMITSMFLHADVFHLLGNLLFFFLSGPFIEDVFGRPVFAGLYFLGGIAAELMHSAWNVDPTVRTIGASGAIAAIMGAYLIRFHRSKLEFLFIPFLFRPTTYFRFFLPAFVVLPLWFAEQVWEMQSEGGSGVAFSAHVGGFVFGLLIALALKTASFEQKFVDPVVIKQTTWATDERLTRAMDANRVGNSDAAKSEISAMLRDDPNNVDALLTAIDIARGSEDWPMLDNAASRLLSRYVEMKEHDLADSLIRDVTEDFYLREARIPKLLARAAAFAERSGDRDRALLLYERLCNDDPDGPTAVQSLMKIGGLLRSGGDVDGARNAFTKARAHPACNTEWMPAIDARLASINGTVPVPPRAR